ncbi:MAG: ABC transporter permease [Chloroflexi bacterium]|nr:ABC transporter permease [Chloroflexota bacterium]
MARYIVRRILQAIPTFFGITVLAYLLMSLTPGGPLAALYFANPRMSPQDREAIGIRLGVNDPAPVQYLRWLIGDDWMRWDSDGDGVSDGSFLIPLDVNDDGEPEPPGDRRGVLRGDFGRSFFNNRAVLEVLTERLPATLELSVSSFILGTTGGVVVGVLAALYKGRWFDNFSRILAVIFDSIPAFWLGLILLLVFSVTLGWLPLGDRCRTTLDPSCPPIWQRLNYLILPVFVLSVSGVAVLSRYVRASMLEIIGNDYIRTARAKGVSERQVVLPRAAQRSDHAGHLHWAGHHRSARRRGHHRNGVQLPGRRPDHRAGLRTARLSDRHGGYHLCSAGDDHWLSYF